MTSGALGVLRRSLWPLSACYGGAVFLRGVLFDHGLRRVHRLDVPVISVGNLSVGGTGKTPLVAWLVEQAHRHGHHPGVLARGYGRGPDEILNDEGAMLAARFPGLRQVQDQDRVRGGRRLVDELGADLVILDDGFQHRRLHRDVDLVCLDARRPLQGGSLLPAGDLREPASALRRAQVAILTRAGGLPEEHLQRVTERLRRLTGEGLAVFRASHEARDLLAMPGRTEEPLESLRGRRVLLLSAIARPDDFARSVEELGAEIIAEVRRRDHHRHTPAELDLVAAQAARQGALLLVTEKDESRLSAWPVERAVLRLRLRFLGELPPAELLGL